MLQLPILSLFLRTIPEGILLFWTSYIILKKPINKKNIGVSGILLGIITYLVRMLPIYFGVHMILTLIGYIFILHRFNHINLYQAVTACITSFILIVICEWITIIFYTFVLGVDAEVLSSTSLVGILSGLPSLLLLLSAGIIIKYLKKVRETEVE